jgi:hypothetical protein
MVTESDQFGHVIAIFEYLKNYIMGRAFMLNVLAQLNTLKNEK